MPASNSTQEKALQSKISFLRAEHNKDEHERDDQKTTRCCLSRSVFEINGENEARVK
jgi:hypothetical protein